MARFRLAQLGQKLNKSWVRFLLVGGCGELLYLGLFTAASRAWGNTPVAIALAGGICLVTNAILHARISFRIHFRWSLLMDYLLIQLVCLLLSLLIGWGMDRIKISAPIIGLSTMVAWASLSFVMTRWRFQRSGNPELVGRGLASKQTNHWP